MCDAAFHPGLITLTLHAEATTVLVLSDARQNISKPWPYLVEGEEGKEEDGGGQGGEKKIRKRLTITRC